MITYPGLPAPAITPFLTREASRAQYAPGTEFAIDQLTMVGNTGTYLDAPYHRFAGRRRPGRASRCSARPACPPC